MIPLPVSPEKRRALEARLQALGVRDADLDETFVHAGGRGGQNVNKVATCVVLVHRPSGVSVKCQMARTQGLNRYHARRLLADKLAALIHGEMSARQQEAERIRRQKRRRSRRSKQRMLADKRKASEKKALRRGPGASE